MPAHDPVRAPVSFRRRLAAAMWSPASSSASVAGLKVGDVIVEFNGQKIIGAPDLIAKVSGTSPDNSVTVSYLRENGSGLDRRTAMLRLGERPLRSDRGEESSRTKLPLEKTKEEVKPFGLTLVDSVVEDRTREVAAAERVVHMILGVTTGAWPGCSRRPSSR